MEYRVLRQHMGDKDYVEGDTREVTDKNDAKWLIDQGLIGTIDDKAKAEADAKNKAKAPPKNKAEPDSKSKSE